MALSFQRETDDWAYIPVTQNGVAYTGSWSYQITAYGARPTGSWLTAVVNSGSKGIDIQGMSKGFYWLWIRIDGQGVYVPVLDPIDLEIV
jgi:hypothetical protein